MMSAMSTRLTLAASSALRRQMAPVPAARAFASMKGTVKFFNAERGFGFIEADGKDFFIHYTGIESQGGFRSLAEGEEVEFDVETEGSGKERAVRVTGPGGAPVKGAQRQQQGYGGFGGDGGDRY